MAMHNYHEALPGYHPDQIFHDGCAECERRGDDVELALMHMDTPTFQRAWVRALDYWRGAHGGVEHASASEMKVLRVIGMMQGMMDRADVSLYD